MAADPLTLINSDCRTGLKSLPDGSAKCCVTSPPFWGLRDYGHPDQIGREPTPEQYVANLVTVFGEVYRVLADDGTLWLNLGDSYARSGGTTDTTLLRRARKVGLVATAQRRNCEPPQGLKSKDLVGIPWMVAFALRANGWFLRQDIIWHKPNPMPESVTDRCTKAHEYIFLLSKSERYYYDAGAIAEPAIYGTPSASGDELQPPGTEKPHTGLRPRASKKRGEFAGKTNELPGREAFRAITETRNKRDVWTVPSQPYSGAHFACFPPNLIRPCILAGAGPGDVVLDPFGGSGTTGAVAIESGRRATLIELNREYCALIRQRCTTTIGLPLSA